MQGPIPRFIYGVQTVFPNPRNTRPPPLNVAHNQNQNKMHRVGGWSNKIYFEQHNLLRVINI